MALTFVLTFVLYLLGTSFVARFDTQWYPLAYSLLVLLIGATQAWLLLRPQRPGAASQAGVEAAAAKPIVSPHWRILPALVVGILGIVLWIFISHLHPEQWVADWLPGFLKPQPRVGYNPFEEIESPAWRWAFIAFRLLGIAIVVPIAEELFWRGFLMRWLIDPEWERVPLGEYTLSSCLTVTLMFTLAHPEWLAAAVYCLLINGLMYWKRDLWQCIVAHGVSNLALAIYVMLTGAWWLW
ncbi:CAAX prenyl protease-related protein [Aureliella helgolandensis]|uniref:CAAX amino terminal protease self-immunity n=1 Tax=Aureliella helgolandensis TaxID=2527968 RepID=A0A518GGM8_9BACT|nr:CAAX prenyl protease-related protein [Aureliella helgolandensis]QDV27752.1 CAAX amino terminal protease self- immunity [Aureliella helgolandensis]